VFLKRKAKANSLRQMTHREGFTIAALGNDLMAGGAAGKV
jgi:hypothetical protein